MLHAAILVTIAIVAAILGVVVVAAGAVEIAVLLSYVFLSLFVACLACGLIRESV